MPIPRWMATINKKFLNPKELERGVRPVITHVGRTSGKVYRTPLDAQRVEGGFIFIAVYGSDSDWVQNVLASGSATLNVGEDRFDLVSARIIPADLAWELLPRTTKAPPSRLKGVVYLLMDISNVD